VPTFLIADARSYTQFTVEHGDHPERRWTMKRHRYHGKPIGRLLLAPALAAGITLVQLLPVGGGYRAGPVQAARPAQTSSNCQNIQLLIRPQTSQGAAGTIAILYHIHNMRSRACTLIGYPGVQFLDRNFASLPTTVHRGGGFAGNVPVRRVTLGPNGNAYFALFYSDVPTANASPCATAPYIMVFAPNTSLPVVTYATTSGPITECTGNVHVTPVTAQPTY
jgi:hypothetical protein